MSTREQLSARMRAGILGNELTEAPVDALALNVLYGSDVGLSRSGRENAKELAKMANDSCLDLEQRATGG